MTDYQDGSPSTDGAAFQNGKQQDCVHNKDLASGNRTLSNESMEEKEKNDISHHGNKERNSLFGGVDRKAATNEAEGCQSQKDTTEPIAIIGFSLRFPQDAVSSQGFWKMLYQGRSAMTEVPEDRFNIKAFYHPESSRISSVRPGFPIMHFQA